MVKHFFYAVLLTVIPVFAYSQEIKEVTLVVNGNGVTKEAATQIALRSAIEQAFGVFVSANTSILNDNLVKDEIATVSSGNIQKFTELGVIKLPDGQYAVTIQATVSINKLVKYAQSKGSECEFAGATFGANLKLLQLRYDNAKDALSHLREYTRIIGSHVFDYEISVGEPRTSNGDAIIPVTIKYIPNEMTKEYFNTVLKTLDATAFNREEMDLLYGVDSRKYRFNYIGKIAYPDHPYHHPYYALFNYYGFYNYGFPIAIEYREFRYNDGYSLMDDFNKYVINGFVIKDNNGNIIERQFIKEDLSGSKDTYVFYDNFFAYKEVTHEDSQNKVRKERTQNGLKQLAIYALTGDMKSNGETQNSRPTNVPAKGGKILINVNIPINKLHEISKVIVEPK